MLNGGMELLSTIRPRRMASYRWDRPIGAFEWPMDSMQRLPGESNLDYDQLLDYLEASGGYWWVARIYKSYTGLLDCYIMWKGENAVTRYILEFDPMDVTVGANYDGWPQPPDFYLARRAIRTEDTWTIDEYNALGELIAEPIAEPPAATIVDDDEGRTDTLEQAHVEAAIATTMPETIENEATPAPEPIATTMPTTIDNEAAPAPVPIATTNA